MSSHLDQLPPQCTNCPQLLRAQSIYENRIKALEELIEINEECLAVVGISTTRLLNKIDERLELEELLEDTSTHDTLLEVIAAVAVMTKCDGPVQDGDVCGVQPDSKYRS